MKNPGAVLAVCLFGLAPAAFGQTGPVTIPRGFVSVGGGYQVNSNDFQDSATWRLNAEDAQRQGRYEVKAAPTFDLAGGATLWRQLGVSVGVSQYSQSTATTLTASLPHPFFFNRARSVDGAVANLSRKELAVHVQARGIFPVSPRVLVMVFGGPSFFRVSQGVVTDITYTEDYPYDTASFDSAVSIGAEESKVGFNVGGDVAFFFARQVGIGFTARYAAASVELTSSAGKTIEVKAGGMQIGAGLQLRF